jgi:hypothetical protein
MSLLTEQKAHRAFLENTSLRELKERIDSPLSSQKDKSAATDLYKQYLARKELLSNTDLQISMCNESLKYKGLLAPVTYAGACENARIEAGELTGMAGLPFFVPPVRGITLKVSSGLDKLPEEVTNYLVNQVESFMEKGLDIDLLTRLAPEEAYSLDGQLNPLPTVRVGDDPYAVEEALLLFSAKKLPMSFRLPTAWRAWQWLIASHNMVYPRNRVKLRAALRKEWSDPLDIKRTARAKERASEVPLLRKTISSLEEQLVELRSQITELLTEGKKSPHTRIVATRVQETADRAIAVIDTAASTISSSGKHEGSEDEKDDASSTCSQEDEDWIPEVATLGRQEISLCPYSLFGSPEFWDKRQNTVSQLVCLTRGSQHFFYLEEKPTQVTLDLDRNEFHPVKVTPAKRSRSPTPGPKGRKPKSKGDKQAKPQDAGTASQGKVPDQGITTRVRKSDNLTEEQRADLRKFFKLQPPLPKEEWAALSSKEKRAVSERSSIPRWATATVVQRPDLLQEIIAGRVTVDNFRNKTTGPPPEKSKGGVKGDDRRGQSRGRSRSRDKGSRNPRDNTRGRSSTRKSRRKDGKRNKSRSPSEGYELIGKLLHRLMG